MRQAVWDVTDYVAAAGPGSYTVADIATERAGAWLPYASWAIVVAYELDPASGIQLDQLPAAEQQRFAPRAVSWHDGFVVRSEGSVDVPVAGFTVTPGVPGVRQELPRHRPPPGPRRRQRPVRRGSAGQQPDAGERSGAGRRADRRRAGLQHARPTSSTTRSACSGRAVETKVPGPIAVPGVR